VYDPQTRQLSVQPIVGEDGEGLERAKAFALEHERDADDIVHPVMVPERVELQSQGTLVETKRFAREHDLPVRLHAAQGAFEYRYIMEHHHMPTVQYLDSIGFLDSRTLIPHALYTSGYHDIEDQSDDDLDVLRDRGSIVIHCPLVYARGGKRLESFARFRRHGIRLCMGSDTFPPDMLRNIRAGSAMSQSVDGPSPDSGYRAFFEAATIGGADALGRPDLGRLAPGCKADFIAVSLADFGVGTTGDPLTTICMMACGSNVFHSVINGRTAMSDGVIPGLDYDALRHKAQRYYDKFRASAIERSSFGAMSGDGSLDADHFFQTPYDIVG
jgi:cytosine/adenosine deaminase-related metal-dependent hydrolase